MAGEDGPRPRVRPSQRVTIGDVATFAGVSPTTVSHVLSGKRAVGTSTKGAVLEAVRQLGYRPNHVARHLRTRRSQMVAVVVPDITNPFYGVVTRGLADAVDRRGYGTYVFNSDGHPAREERFLQDALDRGVDGIVVAATSVAGPTPDRGAPVWDSTPVVCIGGALDHPHADLVAPDDAVGSQAAVTHLIDRGSSRIAMIQGPPGTGAARTHGYLEALAAREIDAESSLLVHGDWTGHGGRTAMRTLLGLARPPDAVFCANDLMAIGAMDVARDRGLSIPADLAVVGFDDVEAASMISPRLTTVQNPAYDAGRAAGLMLADRMAGEYTGAGRTVLLPCPVVVRESA